MDCVSTMASIWDSRYLIESISEDYDDHFKKESDNSLVTYYKVIRINKGRNFTGGGFYFLGIV